MLDIFLHILPLLLLTQLIWVCCIKKERRTSWKKKLYWLKTGKPLFRKWWKKHSHGTGHFPKSRLLINACQEALPRCIVRWFFELPVQPDRWHQRKHKAKSGPSWTEHKWLPSVQQCTNHPWEGCLPIYFQGLMKKKHKAVLFNKLDCHKWELLCTGQMRVAKDMCSGISSQMINTVMTLAWSKYIVQSIHLFVRLL